MIRIAERAPVNSSIPPLFPSCFYFTDQGNAKVERSGLSAKAANARLRLTLRIIAAENDKKRREKRIDDLKYFYNEAAIAGVELTPFDD